MSADRGLFASDRRRVMTWLVLVSTSALLLYGCNGSTDSVQNRVSGLKEWPTLDLDQVSCRQVGYCVIVGGSGTHLGGRGSIIEQVSGRWMPPLTVGSTKKDVSTTLYFVSCVKSGDCIAGGDETTHEPVDNTSAYGVAYSRVSLKWSDDHETVDLDSDNVGPITTACSLSGTCWYIAWSSEPSDPTGSPITTANGEEDGKWFAPYQSAHLY